MVKIRKNMAKQNEANAPGKLNQIVEGTEIKGTFNSDSNMRVDGKIDGTIDITGKLVLGVNGYIEGDIVCENAEIEGTFKGNIKVRGFLVLKATAKIYGDIYTQKFSVEPGAVFTGNCIMGGDKKIEKAPSTEKNK
jgi:cytoskeletal protein CcmA (bactofilin family)